jgi:HEAT repeat protein
MLRPFGRPTPSGGTPEAGARVVADPRAALALARALGVLVDSIAAMGDPNLAFRVVGAEGTTTGERPPLATGLAGVREALRQAVARARAGSLICRLEDGALTVDGVVASRDAVQADPVLVLLEARMRRRGAGVLAVREGAAPAELLSLGHLLASDRPVASRHETPAQVPPEPSAQVGADDRPEATELLRTWSIHLTAAAPQEPDRGRAPSVGAPPRTVAAWRLGHFAAARTAEAIAASVEELLALAQEATARGDAATLEGVATALAGRLRELGGGPGRLACEGGLRRLATRETLPLLASRVADSAEPELLLAVLARSGAASVAALLGLLGRTDDPRIRRACFDAIVALDAGTELVLEALDDPRWYVVRNAAALLGELRAHDADRALARLLAHGDARVRLAVARALVRLRSPAALAALQQALGDASPDVRRLAATAFALGAHLPGTSRPSAAPLIHALEAETDEDVALEMIAALGRLGSADAVQRLLRVAQRPPLDPTTGELPEPQPAWMRVAAIEALVVARGSAPLERVLAELREDADGAVAMAATQAAAGG